MIGDLAWLGLAIVCGLCGVFFTGVGVRILTHEVQARAWRRSLVAFEVRLPRNATADEVARWLATVRTLVPRRRGWSLLPDAPVSVETTATVDGIRHVVVVSQRLRTDVVALCSAALPGARVIEAADYLTGDYGPCFAAATEMRIRGSGDLLATDRSDDANRHLLAALQPLQAEELVRVQWLLTGATAPRWIRRPGVDPGSVPKVWQAGPVMRAVCRVAVVSAGRRRARALQSRVLAALSGMDTPRTRIVRRWWPRFVAAARLNLRMFPRGRWPILATTHELAGLLGLAVGADALPGVSAEISRVLPPSPAMGRESTADTGLVVAESNYPGTRTLLRLSVIDRLRHMWILGPTGTGKSTLLTNLIGQAIAHGDGLVLVDAGGDLVADVLDRIPEHRAGDVIVIDPTHNDHIVGINPLQAGPPEQAAGFTYHVLHAIWAGAWGPRTADIMRAALLTLTAATASNGQTFTLIDIPALLTNAGFRRYVTAQPLPPQLRSFWRWYDSMPIPQQLNITGPVLNKLRTFTLSSALRGMLGQSRGVRFGDVLSDGRIVLVALKKGILGAETSSLIGSLVMASVWQSALERVNLPKELRRPVWLVADEFQDVVRLPLDLADMAAQARSLGLGLVLAHQYLAQLPAAVKTAVLGTVRSQIVFQLGRDDAGELAPAFAPLTATDLHTLGAFEVAARLCVNGATAPPVTGTTYPMPPVIIDGVALAAVSRRCYGLSVSDVDEQIMARIIVSPTRGERPNRITFGGGDQL